MPTIANRLRTLYNSIVLLVNSINSISAGKADKVALPTEGNFAGLDSTGNLTDSGKKTSDFANVVHTHTSNDITGLQDALDAKQDELHAGANITITGTTISATDTTYEASDFDIKDLTDSTNLRTTWSGK